MLYLPVAREPCGYQGRFGFGVTAASEVGDGQKEKEPRADRLIAIIFASLRPPSLSFFPARPSRFKHQSWLDTWTLSNAILSTLAGNLQYSTNGARWWVENKLERRPVIGTVTFRAGDGYRVDIGAGQFANFDGLALEGATKRSKPNLKVWSLVYARANLANEDIDPEIECSHAQTRKAEGYCEVKGGFVTSCSRKMSRNLLDPKHYLLSLLGSKFPLDATVGVNGRIWLGCKELKRMITVVRCVEAADTEGEGKGASSRF